MTLPRPLLAVRTWRAVFTDPDGWGATQRPGSVLVRCPA